MNASAPGWLPDPSGRHEYRYWDGTTWTDDVSDNGVTSTDPLAGGGPGYPGDQAPTAPFEPTQAYGQGPGAPGYGQPGAPSGPYPPAGGYPPAGPGGPGGPGGYDPYGTGGGFPPATPKKSGPPVGLLIGIAIVALAVIVGLVIALSGGDDDDTATDDDATTTTQDDTTDTTAEEEATTTTAASDEGDTQDVFALGVGDCTTDESLTGEVQEVTIIDCSQPHTVEVFHSYLIPDESLPDDAGIQAIVEEQCLPAFQDFVGLDYNSSVLLVNYLSPTPDSWDAGDRELLCLIEDPAGTVTGSLAGANR